MLMIRERWLSEEVQIKMHNEMKVKDSRIRLLLRYTVPAESCKIRQVMKKSYKRGRLKQISDCLFMYMKKYNMKDQNS